MSVLKTSDSAVAEEILNNAQQNRASFVSVKQEPKETKESSCSMEIAADEQKEKEKENKAIFLFQTESYDVRETIWYEKRDYNELLSLCTGTFHLQ